MQQPTPSIGIQQLEETESLLRKYLQKIELHTFEVVIEKPKT